MVGGECNLNILGGVEEAGRESNLCGLEERMILVFLKIKEDNIKGNLLLCIKFQYFRRRRGGRKRHDEHLSIILMLIVLIFVICNLPRIILNMHEISVLDIMSECR
jgi:hypothetical protein